jgi:Carboxypeptidase regulatory-like domain
MRSLQVIALALLLLVVSFPLSSQTSTGTIVGTVADQSGAVVAGATVTVTNTGTGIAVKTTTDSTGNYVVTPLAVGTYSVTVEAAGFKKSISSNITVNVQDRVRVDSSLQIGELAGNPKFGVRLGPGI